MSLSNVRSVQNNASGTPTSLTVSIDCTGTTSERFLVVFVAWRGAPARTITAATYDSVALTLARTTLINLGVHGHAVYFMPEADLPVSGSKVVSITFSGACQVIHLQAALAEADTLISVLDDNSAGVETSVNTLDVQYDNTGKVAASTLVYDSSYDVSVAATAPTFTPDDGQTEIEDAGLTLLGSMCLAFKLVSSTGTFTQSHTSDTTDNAFMCSGVVLDEFAVPKAFSDAGAEGAESLAKIVAVPKVLSDAGAEGAESYALIIGKVFSDAGAEGSVSFAITKSRGFSDAGAEGAESFSKTVFIIPTYLQNKFEAIMVKIIE